MTIHEGGATKTMPLRLASIWAQDKNGVLGSGTDMLWHVPADFAHFKSTTMGCPVIMGRASWEALGRALPGRLNVVLTRRSNYNAPGAVLAHSMADALETAEKWAQDHGSDTIWITGGGKVYADTMDVVDELVISYLDLAVPGREGLVHAPTIDENIWIADLERSDSDWRETSGDARWKIRTFIRR